MLKGKLPLKKLVYTMLVGLRSRLDSAVMANSSKSLHELHDTRENP